MIEVTIAGIILGITLAFMVGPVFLVLLETSLTKGVQKAIVFDLGVISADILFIGLVSFSSALILTEENVVWIYTLGGLLIISYGIYNLFSAKKKQKNITQQKTLPLANSHSGLYFAKGFLMNFLNVGVLAYWLTTTVTLQATLTGDPNARQLTMIYFIATVAAYFGTDLIKIFAAHRIKKWLTPLVLIKIERLVGVILIVFGAFLILRGYLFANGIGPEANSLG